MTRRHNDTNVIALGARITSKEDIISFIDMFLTTPFDGGRHETRVNKINSLEK
jgi:ribose 5-phosphate isomerase B